MCPNREGEGSEPCSPRAGASARAASSKFPSRSFRSRCFRHPRNRQARAQRSAEALGMSFAWSMGLLLLGAVLSPLCALLSRRLSATVAALTFSAALAVVVRHASQVQAGSVLLSRTPWVSQLGLDL